MNCSFPLAVASIFSLCMKFPGAVLLALSKTGMYRRRVSGCDPAELLGDKVIIVHFDCLDTAF